MSGAGLVAWMIYLGVRFGDPVAFATVQGAPGWDQGGGPRTWFKVAVLRCSCTTGDWDDAVLVVPQALACVAAVLLVRIVWRRFGWGYAAYTVVVPGHPDHRHQGLHGFRAVRAGRLSGLRRRGGGAHRRPASPLAGAGRRRSTFCRAVHRHGRLVNGVEVS